ncbi:hypothetical protein JCM21900_003488 [Sporobolomyces salmonicolor]
MSLPALRTQAFRQLSRRAFHSGESPFLSRLSPRDLFRSPHVEGTVNDPTPFPPPDKAHGQYHWTFERLLSASLVPLIGATAVSSVNPVLDGVLCTAIVAHSHMGFDQILTDYLHERKFPVLGAIAKWVLRLTTAGVLVGVYQFETNDIGVTELIKRAWKGEKKE